MKLRGKIYNVSPRIENATKKLQLASDLGAENVRKLNYHHHTPIGIGKEK